MKKGVFETVETVTVDEIVLHNGVRLTAYQGIRTLRLASAITYAGCQGLTLPGVVRLCDTDSKHFTYKHLYVGASRAVGHHLLEIE